jgi:hypothetical protein
MAKRRETRDVLVEHREAFDAKLIERRLNDAEVPDIGRSSTVAKSGGEIPVTRFRQALAITEVLVPRVNFSRYPNRNSCTITKTQPPQRRIYTENLETSELHERDFVMTGRVRRGRYRM